jgi:transposase-like protein
MAMRFPLTDLLDEQESYNFLLKTLHPDGLTCKHDHVLPSNQKPQDRSRDPLFDYRCRKCGNVFNILTNTAWQGSHYGMRTIVLAIRGFTQPIFDTPIRSTRYGYKE